MKRLFNATDMFTAEGEDIDRKVMQALKPIFEEAMEKGYSLRDVSHLIALASQMEEAFYILKARDERRKK